MKVFVTGVCGQLGHDAVLELSARGHLCVGSDLAPACEGLADTPYAPLDITDAEAVSHALDEAKPDAVIHCAAWTAVDAAEEHEAQARAVNAQGTANIAAACRRLRRCRGKSILPTGFLPPPSWGYSGPGSTWPPAPR